MEFIVWHYTKGVGIYVNVFIGLLDVVINNFSFGLLIRTLFSPWKRMVDIDKRSGFDLHRFFENLSFNLVSRGVGFIVRVLLLVTGLVFLVLVALFGILGVLVWVIFPPLGIPFYLKYRERLERFIGRLKKKLIASNGNNLEDVFSNKAGSFVLSHLGIFINELTEGFKVSENLDLSTVKSYSDLIGVYLKANIWSDDYLRKIGISRDDMLFAAGWWDDLKRSQSKSDFSFVSKGPSLALSLLYGYTPVLNRYSIDLTAPQDFSHHLIGRENIVTRIERELDAGNSVVLIGDPGVGKRTVVLEFARRARLGQFGPKMAYRRILEVDYNSLLSEAKDLNSKKNILKEVLEEAAEAGNIILMIRDIHRLTNMNVEGYDFTDVFVDVLEEQDLKIVAVATSGDYERFIAPNMRIRRFLKKVEVIPPTKDQALVIARDAATAWERKRKIIITVQSLRDIINSSDAYITETPFPEKALEILDAAVEVLSKKGEHVLKSNVIDQIFKEKTGISSSKITGREKEVLSDLEEIIHKSLINQEEAVGLIGKSLRSRTVGITKKSRPLGSFLFLGPTGVGKTETAKVLANVYYGSERKMVRFDMAQYASKDGLERLIGDRENNYPGDLSTAIKNNPVSLLLLDEIEKAGPKVHNSLLTILDEGYLMDAFGKKINCKNIFIIGTTNAAADYVWKLVNEGVNGGDLQSKVVDYILSKGLFSPEFLNRFDGVIVYKPLSESNLVSIAKLMLNKLKKSLNGKGIKIEFAPGFAEKLAKDGYDPAFGARPMRRIVDLVIGDMLGKAILKDEIKPGDKIMLIPKEGKERYGWQKIT